MFSRRRWIPPGALIFAQIAHGASWLLIVLWGSLDASWTIDPFALAWVHAVALGWATTAAIAVLLHVVPQFADVRWRLEGVARRSVFAFACGVVAFVAVLLVRPAYVAWPAALVVLALVAYVAAAFATLERALHGERVERAIARATGATLLMLLATAAAGFALALLLGGVAMPPWIARLPAAHAGLGVLGWLSLLIFGVSARTIRPIAGDGSRFRAAHIVVGSATLLGVVLLALGLAGVDALRWPGAALVGIAAIAYALDLSDILRRSTVPHRPPQAFAGAAIVWLLCGIALGAGTLAGRPWALAYGFVMLAGWIGQMLDAHFHHIGVRLLLTVYRGDDDETRPGAVLDSRLSWFAFGAFQLAVATVAVGLLAQNAVTVTSGGALGLAGWIAMTGNMLRVTTRLRHR